MSPDNSSQNGEPVSWFDLVDEESLDEVEPGLDAESYGAPQVSFDESLEAIQADSLAPMDLTGFNGNSRKQIHELRAVWSTLGDEKRTTLADVALVVATELPYGDFGRFFLVLLDDSLEQVRLSATAGAALSESPSLIKPLVKIAESDPSLDVREGAIAALTPQVEALDFGLGIDQQDERLLRRLKTWAKDASLPASIRVASLRTYAHDTSDDATMAIIEAFVQSDDDAFQMGAMQAMAHYGAGRFTSFLERELRSPDTDRREAAATAMGQSSDAAVIPMLTMAGREDAEPIVREAVYGALANIGTRAAVRSLRGLRDNASDDEIELIDEKIAYATELMELEELSDYELGEIGDDETDEI